MSNARWEKEKEVMRELGIPETEPPCIAMFLPGKKGPIYFLRFSEWFGTSKSAQEKFALVMLNRFSDNAILAMLAPIQRDDLEAKEKVFVRMCVGVERELNELVPDAHKRDLF